ncbi:MAG: DUF1080 domain-containing protein [Planctomycetaceae bacterium]
MLTCRWLAVVATLFLASGHALSQAQDEKLAITDLSQVDEDFAFQGEFVGDVVVGMRGSVRIGLQVIALGGGKFQAVEYPGGLPADGWIGHGRVPLSGEKNGSSVRLEGYPLEIVIENGEAHVFYTGGTHAGVLKQVFRVSPTYNLAPACEADVLFDGSNTTHFKNGQITPDGLLMAGTETVNGYQNFKLHLEFRLPYMPNARGQGRANSGVYLNGRYEVQILDSFGLTGEDNEAGGIYRYKRPDVNMCFPPLAWQTYDIEFHAATFNEAGQKTDSARLTVVHNGVTIHDNVAVTRKSGGGAEESPVALPIQLQDHGNPVVFRNIWIVDYDKPVELCCCVGKKCKCCTTCVMKLGDYLANE